MTLQFKTEMPFLVASIIVIPFLGAWPFLSAFPIFSLLGRTAFDVPASLDVVFLLTGFWVLGGGFLIVSWLTDGRVQTAKSRHKFLFIGGYAMLWSGLYAAAAMWTAH